MRGLTDKQHAILCFLVEKFKQKTQYPTVREICQEFRLDSTNGAASHLQALVKKGWIVKEKGNRRGIYFTLFARRQFGLLFEYELRRMTNEQLCRRLGQPIEE